MRKSDHKVILISGASSGLGESTARYLASLGHRVYGTSRFAADDDISTQINDPDKSFVMLAMDVSSNESVKKVVSQIVDYEGRLDVVFNNAGYGISGSIEDTSLDEAYAIMETNFFGAMRLCKAILPIMRHQKDGYIINTSSIGGLIGLPYQGLYSASKFALEGMTEALSKEVKSWGIKVVLLEPGDCRTGFTANRQWVQEARSNPAYEDKFTRAMSIIENDENSGYSAEKVASLLNCIINDPRPKLRYTVGFKSQRMSAVLKRIMPDRMFEDLIIKYYE